MDSSEEYQDKKKLFVLIFYFLLKNIEINKPTAENTRHFNLVFIIIGENL